MPTTGTSLLEDMHRFHIQNLRAVLAEERLFRKHRGFTFSCTCPIANFPHPNLQARVILPCPCLYVLLHGLNEWIGGDVNAVVRKASVKMSYVSRLGVTFVVFGSIGDILSAYFKQLTDREHGTCQIAQLNFCFK